MNVKRIALFASGSGTNAQNIIEYFADNENISIEILCSNREDALALTRATNLGVKTFVFNRSQFYESDIVLKKMKNCSIDLIVLAGFLWLVPKYLIDNFPILNIHPALLPKYGGKGMYGMRVHQAVVDNGEKKSGISIHHVTEKYDEGALIFQAECEITNNDTPETVAQKIHLLEYEHYPKIIEQFIEKSLL